MNIFLVSPYNRGIIDGLWRGRVKCFGPEATGADLWILIWKEVKRIHEQ